MQVLTRPRQAGKTTEMLRLAAEHRLYIVCPTRADADGLWQQAQQLKLLIPQPITWDEFMRHRYQGRRISGFLIDDVDRCLQSMTAVPILAVSLTDGTELAPPTNEPEPTLCVVSFVGGERVL